MLGLTLALLGCGGNADADRENLDHVVRNRPPGTWSDGDRWRLVEEGRIGGTGDDGPASFGQVVDVEFDPMDRVWVADALQHQIRVFTSSGEHVRTIGRKGGGPAEFQAIAGMDWDPEGNLWVLDSGNSRFAVYDTAGKLVATHSRNVMVTLTPWPGGFDSQGRLYDFGGRTQQQGDVSLTTLVRTDVGTGTADTLRLPPFHEILFGEISRGTAGNSRTNQAPVPFTGTQMWAVDPNGSAWFAATETYRLERLVPNGAPDRVVELDARAPRVTNAEKEQMLKNYAWFEQQGGRLDRSLIPDHHPLLLGFFFDDQGNLWVAPSYDVRKNTPLDVFDRSGTYLGRIEGPRRLAFLPAPSFRGNRMAGVTADADGVQSVVLLRIEKPTR